MNKLLLQVQLLIILLKFYSVTVLSWYWVFIPLYLLLAVWSVIFILLFIATFYLYRQGLLDDTDYTFRQQIWYKYENS
jgi:CHASE2 domain-containing sensor protein